MTLLQFSDDLDHQVHSGLHLISHTLLPSTTLLRLHAQPIVTQSFHVLVDVMENRLVTACGRHDDAQDQY